MVAATGKIPQPKASARVALIGLEISQSELLRECFRHFRVEAVAGQDLEQRLDREKFEGCVLSLIAPEAATVLTRARNSRSNARMVIYGLAETAQQALQFSRFGINAVFSLPLERQGALKVVRSTYLLLVHELRRYVRVPVVIDVELQSDSGVVLHAISQEVSAGGMSLLLNRPADPPKTVKARFELPGTARVEVASQVCWTRHDDSPQVGIRFEALDPGRALVKAWIDDYLDLR